MQTRPPRLAILLLVAIATALVPEGVSAHASLVKSEPTDGAMLQQSPPRVVAWFDQELEASASMIGVFNAQGREIDGGVRSVDLTDPNHASMIVTLSGELSPGRYIVRWKAVSGSDGHVGHPTTGEFVFDIRAP